MGGWYDAWLGWRAGRKSPRALTGLGKVLPHAVLSSAHAKAGGRPLAFPPTVKCRSGTDANKGNPTV